MLNILFWNTNRKVNFPILLDLVKEYRVDFLTLIEPAEQAEDIGSLLAGLQFHRPEYRQISSSFHFATYTSIPDGQIEHCPISIATGREELYSVNVRGLPSLILVVVHGKDRHSTRETAKRKKYLHKLRRDIEMTEAREGHTRTLLIGDFNANPFDEEMESAEGLHALNCDQIAGQRYRTIEGEDHRIFYNPMWKLYGNSSSTPASYYLNNADLHAPHWHMLDQVIYRPSLSEDYLVTRIELVKQAGELSLLNRHGQPAKMYSDHLPVFCRLEKRDVEHVAV
jgi:hypothetical protein